MLGLSIWRPEMRVFGQVVVAGIWNMLSFWKCVVLALLHDRMRREYGSTSWITSQYCLSSSSNQGILSSFRHLGVCALLSYH